MTWTRAEVAGEAVEAVELMLECHLPYHLTAGPRLEDFDVLGLLGSGGYGAVHLAREVHTEELFAMKVSRSLTHSLYLGQPDNAKSCSRI